MSDSVTHGGIPQYSATWQVEVFKGVDGIDLSNAPVKFGTPTIALGEDGASDPFVPVLYGPVGLRSYGHQLQIIEPLYLTDEQIQQEIAEHGFARTEFKLHREMEHVHSIEFGNFGEIRVEGLEQRQDGTAVFVVWTIEPYVEEGDVTE